jgi:hypothetical protein
MSAAACPLHKGQLFDSFDDFKSTLDDWAGLFKKNLATVQRKVTC